MNKDYKKEIIEYLKDSIVRLLTWIQETEDKDDIDSHFSEIDVYLYVIAMIKKNEFEQEDLKKFFDCDECYDVDFIDLVEMRSYSWDEDVFNIEEYFEKIEYREMEINVETQYAIIFHDEIHSENYLKLFYDKEKAIDFFLKEFYELYRIWEEEGDYTLYDDLIINGKSYRNQFLEDEDIGRNFDKRRMSFEDSCDVQTLLFITINGEDKVKFFDF